MTDYYFSADYHLGHANVIKYSRRPFSDVDEMNEAIIERHNALVKPSDLFYFLGDFALCRAEQALPLLKRLNGQKFTIFGNHDKFLRREKEYLQMWQWTADLREIKIGEQSIVLCHFPMLTWHKAHYGAWNLHGHSHGSLKVDQHALRTDVGVDCWDYRPVNFEELRELMATRTFKPIDHHEARE